jgi:hypothetical protein
MRAAAGCGRLVTWRGIPRVQIMAEAFDFIGYHEKKLADLQEQHRQLVEGEMRTWSTTPTNPDYVDTTEETIDRIRQEMAEVERVLAWYKSQGW